MKEIYKIQTHLFRIFVVLNYNLLNEIKLQFMKHEKYFGN